MKKITKFFVLFLLGIISIGALTSCKTTDGGDGDGDDDATEEPTFEISPDENNPL